MGSRRASGSAILQADASERVTFGIGEYGPSAISADGRRLVSMVSDLRQALHRVSLASNRAAVLEPLTGGYTGEIDPCWSPDGTRIVFSSSRTGQRNIWSMTADFKNPTPLTTGDALDERPEFSPDGRQVAFISDRGGRRGIWVVSADGGTPRPVAPVPVLTSVSWSPDGKRLVYAVGGGEMPQIETIDVNERQDHASFDAGRGQFACLVSGRRRDRLRGVDRQGRILPVHDR